MILDDPLSLTSKRRRITAIDSMDAEAAKAKLAAIKERFGREIRVFETSSVSAAPNATANNETDDFYEFTAEDYYQLLATKKEDKFLKTRKIREAEEAARRSRMTKAVIRVRFPDNHTLEATFHPSETLQSLVDLLTKVIAQPEQPFCIYTTPPRKLIKDMSQDFYAAGFCPGAIVYFSHNTPLGESSMAEHTGPFLLEDVVSLKGLDVTNDHGQQSEPVQSAPEPVEASQTPAVQERKPADKKLVKPKWLKM
ncbi:plant UBX domain-containing protein 1-like isoform X2 [Prosopis cineraria]|uniref:plant UBX domain-containing protein 1-like isoform X2 n=1 Tax=Prosopis cineraria TaxID=364024 RepID=UPI00240FD1EE|nr:plant UBX domain-containing protein 1-like isoform X2 [Prosopis cineraria]